ncbi:nuclear transport factor 2 family protein, partial [Anoxybacillus sp. ST4]|uniref:nuclear transport factor 2 family protein n=1 Tax=Anoxybacillus sp. ST4 TaxID=2864181 RepID=UPI001C644D96
MLPLEDQRAIEALLLRYATAADARDMSLLASCFTDDVRADYGEGIGRFEGRDALIGQLSAMLDACGPTLHYISNIVASGDGEGARVRCYTQAVVRLPGQEVPLRTAGTYDDRLRRTDGVWRIAERVYT